MPRSARSASNRIGRGLVPVNDPSRPNVLEQLRDRSRLRPFLFVPMIPVGPRLIQPAQYD